MFSTDAELKSKQRRVEVNAEYRTHGESLASQASIILAGFYNPLTATGGIGTVMRIIGSKFRMLKIVCVEISSVNSMSYMSAGHKVYPLCISETIIEEFHRKVCKGKLWPLLHEEEAELDQLSEKLIDSMLEFSSLYAEHLLKVIKDCPMEPIIWFNDYAMIPVLREFRKKYTGKSRIGISIRSSFGVTIAPKFDSFVKLVIQEGLLAADFVSFHRQRDVYHFLEFVADFPEVKIYWDKFIVETHCRQVIPRSVPMGSCPEYWSLAGKSRKAIEKVKSLQNRCPGEAIILSVSRLEPHKAIEFELDVIERLVRYNPSLRGRFRFLRIMPVFQEYKQLPTYALLKERIERRVLEINQSFGDSSWQPIELISGRSLCHNELAGYYRAASIILVLSHADGFNHVSVESVLSKQESDPPLTLLLSDTGSSDYLDGAFVRADSRSPVDVAVKLARILTADSRWRYSIHTALFKAASACTSLDWAYEVLGRIGGLTEK